MYTPTGQRRRGPNRPAALVGILSLIAATILIAAPTQASIIKTTTATQLANAIAVSPGMVTGASLSHAYVCAGAECPTAVASDPLAGFPASGADYAVLSTGDATAAGAANDSADFGYDWSYADATIGAGVYDTQTLQIDLGAATGNCLAFDFRFLSEEYPEFVQKGFNDAFFAQLGSRNITNPGTGQELSAPGDFAAGVGDQISVDAAGPSAMSAGQSAGTTYDGATLKLVARHPVTPGAANTLSLTILDQGDGIYDSAVFVDNLRYETVAAGQCKSLALDPFEGQTGLDPAAGTSASLNKAMTTISQPLTCTLPPGPFSCNVIAQMVFTGVTSYGGVNARSAAVAPTATVMGATSVSIPAGATATVTVTANGPGASILAHAKKFPKKLLKQSIRLERKAHKVGLHSKKGKLLHKQAVKTRKLANKLAKQKTIGYITLRLVNPANGAVETTATFPVRR